MYLRLIGDVPDIHILEQHLSTAFTLGDQDYYYSLEHPAHNVYMVPLAYWESHPRIPHDDLQMLGAIALINYLSDYLRGLERPNVIVECFIRTKRNNNQGGLGLPPALFMAFGAAGLSLSISLYDEQQTQQG
jgi:hypothetical protein